MVVIRLSRGGTNKRPFYHIVVADSRRARDGRNIERIGLFNPIAGGKEQRIHIIPERVQYWISKGAKPSDRVAKLIKDYAKLAEGKNIARKKSKKKTQTAKIEETGTSTASA